MLNSGVYCATLPKTMLYASSTPYHYLNVFFPFLTCPLYTVFPIMCLCVDALKAGTWPNHSPQVASIISTCCPFFFHWTVSPLFSCLPSHWLSEIHCFSICSLHPWLAVLRTDLQSFEYSVFHILPFYSTLSHHTKKSHFKCH